MSGGDIQSSSQCGPCLGLTVAVVARRSGGGWDLVAFRCYGDRGVGSTHYGRCASLISHLSVAR